ncbi:MAG: exodeoxyribonuclease VII large subunit, partial [Burkholderiales bacterium]
MNSDNAPIVIGGAEIVTVGELTHRVRDHLEHGFAPLWVSGEISNFTRAASGHCYFSLKDTAAQVR